ncbi:hypothetical protein AA973_04485 [Helicobacter pylori]|uniref:Uncharacterized protein n=1 Tax=Helicobacter pylori TaxID=210 RepID=A0A1A9HBH7_HELPX|nr:hypothetical protein AA973_04485 [Helicobacter pylori]
MKCQKLIWQKPRALFFMLANHQSIRSVIDLKSQCIFNLIKLHTLSNTDNIFPIKIIDSSSSDFIKQATACYLFSKDCAHQ